MLRRMICLQILLEAAKFLSLNTNTKKMTFKYYNIKMCCVFEIVIVFIN